MTFYLICWAFLGTSPQSLSISLKVADLYILLQREKKWDTLFGLSCHRSCVSDSEFWVHKARHKWNVYPLCIFRNETWLSLFKILVIFIPRQALVWKWLYKYEGALNWYLFPFLYGNSYTAIKEPLY